MPMVVVLVILGYGNRTGKSFFLNQLCQEYKQPVESNLDLQTSLSLPLSSGFQVGHTTESCTRGIWIRNPKGFYTSSKEKILFMDTEGMAALDNDESYDAKIFSLGLLLSSLFVFNSIGVIDEGAMDRLFLVSELTKNICVHSNNLKKNHPVGSDVADENDMENISEDELAPFFPPFVWLLRDFSLNLQVGDRILSPNEYLESALEIKAGTTKRVEERNRIRKSLRSLFHQRECVTLVRPVVDEEQLKVAGSLKRLDLRPEFVHQMDAIRSRVLTIVKGKTLYGQALNGSKLAHLVSAYLQTINSGAIPDIKVAWEYVAEATCQQAEQKASALYHSMIQEIAHRNPVASQAHFDDVHKKAQEAAFNLFKAESVEGSVRMACLQRLKENVQREKSQTMKDLEARSRELCHSVCKQYTESTLRGAIRHGKCDSMDDLQSRFQSFFSAYEENAQGPAKKPVLFQFCIGEMLDIYALFHGNVLDAHRKKMDSLEAEMVRSEKLFEETKRQTKEEMHFLQIKHVELEKDLDAKNERIQRFEKDIQTLQEGLEKMTTKKEGFEIKLEALNQQKLVDQAELLQKQHELQEAKIHLGHLQAQYEQAQQEAMREREDHRLKLSNLQEEHKLYQQRMNAEISEKDAKIRSANETNQQLQGAMAKHRAAKEALATQMEKLEALNKKQTVEKKMLADDVSQWQQKWKLVNDQSAQAMQVQKERMGNENEILQLRLQRIQSQIADLLVGSEIKLVLEHCITKVVDEQEGTPTRGIVEERDFIREKLSDLYMKISILPDFYQRQIFCAEEPLPTFFEAISS